MAADGRVVPHRLEPRQQGSALCVERPAQYAGLSAGGEFTGVRDGLRTHSDGTLRPVAVTDRDARAWGGQLQLQLVTLR